MSILDEIIAHKREDVSAARQIVPIEEGSTRKGAPLSRGYG